MSNLARTLWDSTTASDIPTTARFVLGYVNGLYKWSDADWARFPDAVKVRCSVTGYIPCDEYDIEQGDYQPSDAPHLLQAAHDAGIERPTLYFSRSLYDAVRLHVDKPGTDWAWHCADWTGSPHPVTMPDGGTASVVQYADPPQSGGHYDLSAIYDDAWPIYIPPKPLPKGPHMLCIVYYPDGAYIVNLTTWTRRGIPDQADETALQVVLPVIELTDALKGSINRIG